MVGEVREAIAEAVQRRYPSMQVSPYILSTPTLPHAYLYPGEVEYDQAMHRGMDTWTFVLRVMVGDVGDIAAQKLLDQILEPSTASGTSMKSAIEQDRTLGGLVYDITATTCTGYQHYQPTPGMAPVIGAEWTLMIRADGGGGA